MSRVLLVLNSENEANLEGILFGELKNLTNLKNDLSNEELIEDSRNNNDIKTNEQTKKESNKEENKKDKKIDENKELKDQTSNLKDENKH